MIVLIGPFIFWLKVIQIEPFRDISERIQSLNFSDQAAWHGLKRISAKPTVAANVGISESHELM